MLQWACAFTPPRVHSRIACRPCREGPGLKGDRRGPQPSASSRASAWVPGPGPGPNQNPSPNVHGGRPPAPPRRKDTNREVDALHLAPQDVPSKSVCCPVALTPSVTDGHRCGWPIPPHGSVWTMPDTVDPQGGSMPWTPPPPKCGQSGGGGGSGPQTSPQFLPPTRGEARPPTAKG